MFKLNQRGSTMSRSVYQHLSVLAARSVWLHASKLTRLRHLKNGIAGNIRGTGRVAWCDGGGGERLLEMEILEINQFNSTVALS
jgi:hypothetical protein